MNPSVKRHEAALGPGEAKGECIVNEQDLVSFPLEQDATLTCPVEGCDLPFKHGPHGPEHPESCGCFYASGENFHLCPEHEEAI